jgi:hypothetical protein
MSRSWLVNIDVSAKTRLFTNHPSKKMRNYHDRRRVQIEVKWSRRKPELIQVQVLEPGRLLELLAATASELMKEMS